MTNARFCWCLTRSSFLSHVHRFERDTPLRIVTLSPKTSLFQIQRSHAHVPFRKGLGVSPASSFLRVHFSFWPGHSLLRAVPGQYLSTALAPGPGSVCPTRHPSDGHFWLRAPQGGPCLPLLSPAQLDALLLRASSFSSSGSHECYSLANLFIPNFTSEICRRTQPATKALSKFGGGRGNKNPHTLQDQTIQRQEEKVLPSQESHQCTLKVSTVEF